jgi:hypothetical protein
VPIAHCGPQWALSLAPLEQACRGNRKVSWQVVYCFSLKGMNPMMKNKLPSIWKWEQMDWLQEQWGRYQGTWSFNIFVIPGNSPPFFLFNQCPTRTTVPLFTPDICLFLWLWRISPSLKQLDKEAEVCKILAEPKHHSNRRWQQNQKQKLHTLALHHIALSSFRRKYCPGLTNSVWWTEQLVSSFLPSLFILWHLLD